MYGSILFYIFYRVGRENSFRFFFSSSFIGLIRFARVLFFVIVLGTNNIVVELYNIIRLQRELLNIKKKEKDYKKKKTALRTGCRYGRSSGMTGLLSVPNDCNRKAIPSKVFGQTYSYRKICTINWFEQSYKLKIPIPRLKHANIYVTRAQSYLCNHNDMLKLYG